MIWNQIMQILWGFFPKIHKRAVDKWGLQSVMNGVHKICFGKLGVLARPGGIVYFPTQKFAKM